MIKFVNDLRQFDGFLQYSVFTTNKTDCHDITEILLKGAINTINHLPEQPSSFLLHNVFALLSGSGGSFRGVSVIDIHMYVVDL